MIVKTWRPVSSFTERRGKYKPEIIVLHIAEGNRQQVYDTFLNEKKSSHYLVNKDGSVWQFVRDEDCAWANGEIVRPTSEIVKSHGKTNPNLYSLSIEHEGYANKDLTLEQYNSSVQLVKELCQKWNIPILRKNIIGHREIKSTKNCPGVLNVARIVIEASKPNAIIPPSANQDSIPFFLRWWNKIVKGGIM